MQIDIKPADTLSDAIVRSLERAEPGTVIIVSVTSEQFRVFGKVHLGRGFLEFQFDAHEDHVVAIPFDKIAYVLP